MGSNEGYNVTIKSTEKVVAVLPVQEHRLPLSNLDLLLPPINVSVFFCFRRPLLLEDAKSLAAFSAMAASLKAALSQVLVTYYPLAGEVVANSAGEPEILCNNCGVDFAEAYADVELKDLNLYDPDDSVEGKLVPKKKDGSVSVQVTELRCGGIVIGCTFDHRVADAYSFNMFMSAWSATALSRPISSLPSFRRSLLSPRSRIQSIPFDPLLDHLFTPLSLCPPPLPSIHSCTPINRIYYIPSSDMAALQAATGASRRSKMVCFTAFLWKLLAESAETCDKTCDIGIVVNGRSRMKSTNEIGTMKNYFGNVLSIPYGSLDVGTLLSMDLADVADEVHRWLLPTFTEEHFLGLVDWVESHRPEPTAARIYLGDGEGDKKIACVVSSGRGFPDVEFGWGKAVFGSYHFPWGGKAGYIMPIPNPETGDWVVYTHLAPSIVAAMEQEPTIFRKLTAGYILGEERES